MHVGSKRREIDLVNSSLEDLSHISSAMSLGLDSDEMLRLKHYFQVLGRNPTDVEVQAMAQAWSEHCCYKSSKYYLKKFFSGLEKGNAILAMEDDAGVVNFDERYAYVLKMESHNHPSAVEPYGGAATGVGGILRDILCMGAQPVALLDSIFLGETWKPVRSGSGLNPRFIFDNVVAGIRDYGNRVGIPNVAGSIDFDACFNGNPLVNAGCVGIVDKSRISRSRVSRAGDVFILCGGGTGRDGIHGVNFASDLLDENSRENRGVVQLGNPIIKEPLIHAILEANDSGLIDGMKDLGGGGLSSSVGEMCLAGGLSAIIDLEKVIMKEDDMEPWEIWVSESQERMLLAVDPANVEKVMEIFRNWDIGASIIGTVTEGTNLILKFGETEVLNLDLEFLTSGPLYCRNYVIPEKKSRSYVLPPEPENWAEFVASFLHSPYGCSREQILRQYDHTVRGSTIIRPITGFPNRETHSDAAVIKPVSGSRRGLAITSGSKFDMVAIDPVGGSYATLFESFLNIMVTGSRPDSLVDCLNMGNPRNPEIMGSLIQIASSISDFCRKFGIPVVAGNVSLYNESKGINIKPSPTIMMVGVIDDVRLAVTTDFKKAGNRILMIGTPDGNLGGSQVLKLMGIESSSLPWYDLGELNNLFVAYQSAIKDRLIISAHDIGSGGLIQAVMEMGFGSMLGFELDLSDLGGFRTMEKMFSEGGSRILIEAEPENLQKIRDCFRDLPVTDLGIVTTGEVTIEDTGIQVLKSDIAYFRDHWDSGMNVLY